MRRLLAIIALLALPAGASDIPRISVKPGHTCYLGAKPLVLVLFVPLAGIVVPVVVVE